MPSSRPSRATSALSTSLSATQRAARFIVYIDGYPSDPNPRRQVSSVAIEPGQHTIYVRLVHPTDRIASLSLLLGQSENDFTVFYDSHNGTLNIIPAQGGRATPPPPQEQPHLPHPVTHATDAAVSDVIDLMNQSAFDKDKLSLGKTFVKQKKIVTDQAIRMAKTITFEDTRLEFLIYAFDYCVDQQNYSQTVETLTFSSSRDKLLEIINR